MAASDRLIRTVTLQSDGATVEYVDSKRDLRDNGLMVNHIVFIPAGEDYDEGLEALIVAAQRLLSDALEDLEVMEPVDPEQKLAEFKAATEEQDDEPDFNPSNYPPKE